jgi:LysM repeat protein
VKRFAALVIVLLLCGGALMLPVGDEAEKTGATVTVAGGDTLGRLAKTHGVTVDDLRGWNQLDGDLIQVGQELAVAPPSLATRPLWEVLLAEWRGGGGEEDVGVERPGVPVGAVSRGPRRGRRGPSEGLVRDEEGRFIDAQGRFVNERGQPIDEDGNVLGEEARSWPALGRPAPKACLDAMTGIGEGGDTAFGRSEGLSGAQVSGAVAAFQEQTLRCAEGLSGVSGQVDLELVIGCDGRVREVTVLQDRVGQGAFAACVADVMRYAPFPAHARDEVTVQIPLRYD